MALADVLPIADTDLYADAALVSAWELAANSNDSVGSNSCTDVNTTYSSSSPPNANFAGYAVFGGTAKSTKSSPTGVPTGTSARSFSCMFKSSTVSATQCMFDTGTASSGQRFSGLALSGGSGAIYFAGHSADVGPGGNIADGAWHYIVFTYDGTTVRIYIDGSETINGTPTLNTASSTLFSMGMNNAAAEPITGHMCDMAMFSKKLTTTEITAHWEGTDSSVTTTSTTSTTTSTTSLGALIISCLSWLRDTSFSFQI